MQRIIDSMLVAVFLFFAITFVPKYITFYDVKEICGQIIERCEFFLADIDEATVAGRQIRGLDIQQEMPEVSSEELKMAEIKERLSYIEKRVADIYKDSEMCYDLEHYEYDEAFNEVLHAYCLILYDESRRLYREQNRIRGEYIELKVKIEAEKGEWDWIWNGIY